MSLGMTRGTAGATPGKNLIQSIYKNIMKAYIKQEETKREDSLKSERILRAHRTSPNRAHEHPATPVAIQLHPLAMPDR